MPKSTSHNVILIVDDEEGVRKTLKDLLKIEGYTQIHTAADGKEAIAKVKKTKYSLILLDVRMPKMNGVEVLRRIKEIDVEVPVAMITAWEDVNLAEEALRSGACDYIKKPFDINYLMASILSKVIPS